jgi:hypothetical protein
MLRLLVYVHVGLVKYSTGSPGKRLFSLMRKVPVLTDRAKRAESLTVSKRASAQQDACHALEPSYRTRLRGLLCDGNDVGYNGSS